MIYIISHSSIGYNYSVVSHTDELTYDEFKSYTNFNENQNQIEWSNFKKDSTLFSDLYVGKNTWMIFYKDTTSNNKNKTHYSPLLLRAINEYKKAINRNRKISSILV